MLELLKKIGVPATVAAVIASLVTTVPLIFKIDERYAKTGELDEVSAKSAKQVQDLTIEVSKLAGVQQTLLTLMVQGEARLQPPQTTTVMVPVQQPAPIRLAVAAPAPAVSEAECERLTAAGFKCMGPEPVHTREVPHLAASAPVGAPIAQTVQVPVKITLPPKSAADQAEDAERKKRFEAIKDVLSRSQLKIEQIQRY
jgi:hypothetical protein